jgi:hypothetical protein
MGRNFPKTKFLGLLRTTLTCLPLQLRLRQVYVQVKNDSAVDFLWAEIKNFGRIFFD